MKTFAVIVCAFMLAPATAFAYPTAAGDESK